MFRKTILATVFVCAPMPAFSEEMNEQKQFSLGIASFSTVIQADTYYGSEDDDFSGFAIFGTGAVNDNVGFRFTYANQSHEEDSNLDLTVLEGSLIAGTGLATTGFKAYGSVGIFSETLKYNGYSEEYDFTGLMLGGGIGRGFNQ